MTNTIRQEQGTSPDSGDGAVAPLYVLFFLSGMTGLVYEVMWMRSFSLVFGSTTRAAAAVLAAFFGGMALGNLLGGRWARQRSAALWRYGLAEIVIAIGALSVGVWLWLYHAVYPALYQSPIGSGGAMTILRMLLAFAALALPCIAMGATLPLMSQALVAHAGHIGRRASGVYALNTIGATLGVLLAGFLLPVWLGTRHTIYAAVATNVLIGVAAMWLSRRPGAGAADPGPEEQTAVAAVRRGDPFIIGAVVLSGFGTLALEVLFTRLIMSETDCSVFSFAVMLATFLVFLALGALVVSIWVDRMRRPWLFLAWTQAIAAVLIMVSPRVFLMSLVLADAAKPASVGLALWRIVGKSVLVMGPAVFLIGMTLPTAWRIASRRAAELGQRVGRLTGYNTLAAVVGSVAAGFVIIPGLGLGQGFALLGGTYALLSMLAWSRVYDDHRRANACLIVGLALGLLYVMKLWVVVPMQPNPEDRLLRYHEGEGATVAVFEKPGGDRYLTVNSHYILGGSSPAAIALQRCQGQLPLTLHPNPEQVAFIGVATGISVSSITEFPVRRVVALELIPGVVDATADFATANRRVLHDPRVQTLVADGRNHLFVTAERFDVVVGDLFIPWEAGTGYLYTTEHFESVACHLKPGGIFAQWLPAYQLGLEEVRIITATFVDVFPQSTLWLYTHGQAPVVALLGCADEAGAETMRQRARQHASRLPAGVSFVCGVDRLRPWVSTAQRNSDEYPRIEFMAAASHFVRSAEEVDVLVAALRSLQTR
ncbi:MAG: fused MFS/spermidine synthase [Planctomycetes bacterium]|nr:fused MFS/spermidine synthase [Planctomycetota bacterium]